MNAAGLYWNQETRGIDRKFPEIRHIGHRPVGDEAVSFAALASHDVTRRSAPAQDILIVINNLRP
jgi:hypothetical protein